MYNKKFNGKLSLQAVGVYQYTDNGKSNNSQENWLSFGLRPVYGLSKYLALEIEPGVDYVDNQQDNYSSFLFKFTTALRLSPSGAFDSHPRFRLFATYAHWGDNFKGHAGGGEAFASNKDGINFGVQCEQWW
jgi:maltoporin